jgi:heme-degrading monooxygenase HmoA
MIRVWEYDVVEGLEAEFETAYGGDGAWAQLFASSSGFLGTTLYRSVAVGRRYVTIDRFVSGKAWERFLVDHNDAYHQLDSRTAYLTVRETELVAVATGTPS